MDAAAKLWLAAGRNANLRVAFAEAIGHLTTGLALIDHLEATRQRDDLELDLRAALGTSYLATKGWPAVELFNTLDPAVRLCQKLDAEKQLWITMFYLWGYHACRTEFDRAHHFVDEFLGAADKPQSEFSVIGHWCGGITCFLEGNLADATSHFESVLAGYDFERHRYIVNELNNDPLATPHVWGAYAQWMMGNADAAAKLSHDAVNHAKRVGHPFNTAWCMVTVPGVLAFRGEPEPGRSWLNDGLEMARTQSLAPIEYFMYPLYGGIFEGLVGKHEEAIRLINAGNAVWQGLGGTSFLSLNKSHLATALAETGRLNEALSEIDSSLAMIEQTGERVCEAETLRVKGTLLLRQDTANAAAAEACFEKAINIARQQSAKSWELRAATSLARVWRSQDRRQEAYDVLAPIYDWFTEGFDTVDLKNARALLEALK